MFVILLFAQFQHYHAQNVAYVYQQPYQMALWLSDNTPEDAVVAVHDVGLMRYMGNRSTLDMVGLTTPDAAAYWRNGPGSVAEFLINQQPDYIASYGYGHGYGLAFLADTNLYANQRAEFTIPNWQPHLNVALAAASQGIYQPDWQTITPENAISPICEQSPYTSPTDETRFYLDTANLASETDHQYHWQSDNLIGFATETRQFGDVIEAYRLINMAETFTASLSPTDESLLLITTIHAGFAGTLDIFLDDTLIDTQWVPFMPGELTHLTTAIPSQYQHENLKIHIEPTITDGFYMPACHTIRSSNLSLIPSDTASIATYQNGALTLSDISLEQSPANLTIDLQWMSQNGTTAGDYRLFVHLYDDINQPPLAQWDNYYSTMPLGNWLQGSVPTDETIQISLADIPAGIYPIAIGFYNPTNPTDRLIPESTLYDITPDGRLFLGEVEVE